LSKERGIGKKPGRKKGKKREGKGRKIEVYRKRPGTCAKSLGGKAPGKTPKSGEEPYNQGKKKAAPAKSNPIKKAIRENGEQMVQALAPKKKGGKT